MTTPGNPVQIGTSPPGPCGTPLVIGPTKFGVKQANDRGRMYSVTYRVQVDPTLHGPLAALWAEGLPAIDSVYADPNGVQDNWAYFTAERDVEQDGQAKGSDNQFYLVTCYATTRPDQGCTNWLVDNPFAVPDRIRVESVNYQREGVLDMDGADLINSAWEQYRGKEIEYDAHRFRVIIEGNRSTSGLTGLEAYLDYVNDMTMWGFAPRNVKLSHFESEPKYYLGCVKYWINKWTFDIADDFDRCIVDEGTRVLRGQWDKNLSSPTYGRYVLGTKLKTLVPLVIVPVDPNVPGDFIRYADWNGQNTRVLLNGNGRPYNGGTALTGAITGATNATNIVITSVGHGLVTNDTVIITGVTGNTAANGMWQIIVNTLDTFTLPGSAGSGAYTGGGGWSSPQTIGKHCFQYYPQTNLLALGVPSVIDPSP